MTPAPRLRPATPEDAGLIWRFLMIACHTDDPAWVRAHPVAHRHAEDWGRPDDFGVIAEAEDGTPLGACWARWMDPASSPYPEIEARCPDIALALAPEAQGRGLGRVLLHALGEMARRIDPPPASLCLNVREGNASARATYEAVGFRVVGDPIPNAVGGASLVMEWVLSEA